MLYCESSSYCVSSLLSCFACHPAWQLSAKSVTVEPQSYLLRGHHCAPDWL